MEHNGVLVARDESDVIRDRCLAFLTYGVRRGDYKRVVLPGTPPMYATASGSFLRRRELSHFVDLDAVREAGDYTTLLGPRTRKNMRRSRRAYEARGAMTFDVAATMPDALAYLERLIDLHETAWRAQGWRGSFSNTFYRAFHNELVRRGAPSGRIQMGRLAAGGREIGYLYNFCHRGRVYTYQAGLHFEEDAVFQPGRMCDWAAIEHSARSGLDVYDFLAGDTQYKRSLATGHDERVWTVVQRNDRYERVAEPLRAGALSGIRAARERLPRPARLVAETVVAAARSRALRARKGG
jgi:CelD/BcsL family acetyltransferase involved in cellulose biosynthesis